MRSSGGLRWRPGGCSGRDSATLPSVPRRGACSRPPSLCSTTAPDRRRMLADRSVGHACRRTAAHLPDRRRGARGIAPRAPHRSGLDTLASSGSCHRTKAAAFRRELELLLLPVGSLPTAMTCPLRSTSITPASSLLQGSPPLSGASVLSASRLEPLAPFPLPSPARFSRSVPEPD